MKLDADVIVIGAGPAGCAAAIRLATAGYDVIALERKEREDGEDITSGEVMVVPTQNECAQIGVKFEGDWVLDRITGFRNVYPDLSWTYHPIPTPISPVQVDRGGIQRRAPSPLDRGRRTAGLERASHRPRISRRCSNRSHGRPQAVLGTHVDRRRRPLRAVAARAESQVRGSGVLANRRRSILQVVRRHSAEYVGSPSIRRARRDDQRLADSAGAVSLHPRSGSRREAERPARRDRVLRVSRAAA